MQKFSVLLLGFLVAAPAWAFSPSLTVPDAPYTPITLEPEGEARQDHLGRLEGYPVLYEITSEEPFVLSAVIRQPTQASAMPRPFSLIAVRLDDRGGGVTEVARVPANSREWARKKDAAIGMTFWHKELTAEVEPGTYRIEVSTPNNEGAYWIAFGTATDDAGYFETLGGAYRTQQFFDRSIVSMLLSSYVYYPIGIGLLLVLLERTWRYRRIITERS